MTHSQDRGREICQKQNVRYVAMYTTLNGAIQRERLNQEHSLRIYRQIGYVQFADIRKTYLMYLTEPNPKEPEG